MSRKKDLLKNTIVLGIGRFLPKLTTFITLPILTACLSKAEYGTYDLISTLIMLVIPIATLQIQSAAFRFLIDCRDNKEKISNIVSNIFVVTLPITIIVSFIIQFFFLSTGIECRIGIALYFFLDTLFLTIGQISRGLGKNKEYSIASIIMSVVNLICIYLTVQNLNKGLLGVIIALCISNLFAIFYLSLIAKLHNYISISNISSTCIKEMLAYSWPMVPNNLSTWVLKLSDRLVIIGFLGVELNAVYSVANKIPNMLSLAQGVIVMAWYENASIAVKDKDADKYYAEMLDLFFSLMFGFTALLIASTPILFRVLIKGDYSEAYCQIPVLILGTFFYVMSAFYSGIYIAHKKTKNVGVSTVIAAIINLVIDLTLVNVIGIWAGAISTLIAYAFLYYYRMFDSKKFQKIKVDLIKQFSLIAIMIVMLVLCFLQNPVCNIINAIISVFAFIIFNYKYARSIMKKIIRTPKK